MYIIATQAMGDELRMQGEVEQEFPQSPEQLLGLVYDELRQLAATKMAREKPGQTLQATALVHEAWLRLAGNGTQTWKNKAHFFGAAAEAMRRILIDRARRKASERHGGLVCQVGLDAAAGLCAPLPDEQMLALHSALTELEALDSRAAELVKLRFFAGLTQAEASEVMGLSRTTADRTWVFARAWLFQRIRPPLA